MGLPTIEKTWRYNINNFRGTTSNLTWHQRLMRAIKDALTKPDNWDVAPTGLWSVDHSCAYLDDLGTPGDGVDRWTQDSDLYWDYNDNASWFVFNTPHNGGAGQFLIDLDNQNSTSANAYPEACHASYAPEGGFTGGTVIGPPTSSIWQSGDLCRGAPANGYWGGYVTGTGPDVQWHMMMSDDGLEMRLFIMQNNRCMQFWGLGEFDDPPASYPSGYNFWGSIYAPNTANTYADVLHPLQYGWLAGNYQSLRGYSSIMTPCFLNVSYTTDYFTVWSGIGGIGDESRGEMPLGEIHIWDIDSAGSRGPKGRIKDMWICPYPPPVGFTLPADGSRLYQKIGTSVVVPWNGSIPQNVGTP